MKHYIYIILTLISICLNFEITTVISEHYTNINYNSTSNIFNITKGNYSTINDGYFLIFNNTKPKQLSFSFLIQNEVNIPLFEACDIRLTSISLNKLKKQNYSTKSKSDIAFFRIKHKNKVYLNDKPIYIGYNKSNFNQSNFTDVDIYFDWDLSKAYLFLNHKGIWNVTSDNKNDSKIIDTTVDFYHEDIDKNVSVNKVIMYNFIANTTCVIKDLKLCDDFCDNNYKMEYDLYKSGMFLTVNKFYYFILSLYFLI